MAAHNYLLSKKLVDITAMKAYSSIETVNKLLSREYISCQVDILVLPEVGRTIYRQLSLLLFL